MAHYNVRVDSLLTEQDSAAPSFLQKTSMIKYLLAGVACITLWKFGCGSVLVWTIVIWITNIQLGGSIQRLIMKNISWFDVRSIPEDAEKATEEGDGPENRGSRV